MFLKNNPDLGWSKKNPTSFLIGFKQKKAGIVLLSHGVTTALPSPLAGLTSEFGMGSGVAPPLKTPANLVSLKTD